MTPAEVLHQWFQAHERADLDKARSLVSEDIKVVVPGAELTGFDDLLQWYRNRAAASEVGFGYSVEDVLGGDSYAAAVLLMSTEHRQWRQVALYRVHDDRITSIWAVEDRV